ncbi:hypothetical protein B0H34DRAFT_783129 [Crassisporium funariophilum]|nr:hypothetical protein B0H34DRAFT_783129 [Crassisporium funariophilum]
MKKSLSAMSPLYSLLGPLSLMNHHIGNNNLTGDKDWKHVFKQLCNLLPCNKGVVITRSTGLSTIIEDLKDVKDAHTARKFLKKGMLLMPPGEPLSHGALSTCLHQIAAMTKLPKQVKNTVQSVAFLVDKLKDNTLHKAVQDAVNSQLGELAANLKTFVEDSKEKIDGHLESRLKELDTATGSLTNTAQMAIDAIAKASTTTTQGTIMGAHSYTRQGIRQRQFMMEGCEKETRLGKMNNMGMKAEVNAKMVTMGAGGRKARSVTRQRNGGLLLEMETDAGAEWIHAEGNGKALCKALGQGIYFKARSHNLIAYNSPLDIDPGNPDHLQEICKINGIEEGQLTMVQWAKPIARRSDTQKTAHLILTFTDVDVANRTVVRGLAVCHQKLKCKKEPIRCLKCQGWNHFAKECTAATDICGTCAVQGHRTSTCPDTGKGIHWCVSCKVDSHASWSRECPTFKRKQQDCNKANPENSLPFIRSNDPWT